MRQFFDFPDAPTPKEDPVPKPPDPISDILRNKRGVLFQVERETGSFPAGLYNPWFVSLVLSAYPENLPALAEADKYDLPARVHYRFMLAAIPRPRGFQRIIGKDRAREARIRGLSLFYGWSRREAEKNLGMFTEADHAEISDCLNQERSQR
jgi:hypothetical protein